MGCSTRKLIGFLCGIVDNTSTNPAVPSSNHQPPLGPALGRRVTSTTLVLCAEHIQVCSRIKKKGRTVEEDT